MVMALNHKYDNLVTIALMVKLRVDTCRTQFRSKYLLQGFNDGARIPVYIY